MTESAYKPGDVANGHILTSEGHWVPMGSTASSSHTPHAGPAPLAQQPWVGGPASQQVTYVVDGSNNTSLAPVTSLVTGLIGLFFSWIPIIGIIGWIFGPLAVVFGILGLRRGKAEHKIMSWIGIVCGAITLLICLAYVVFLAVGMSGASGMS